MKFFHGNGQARVEWSAAPIEYQLSPRFSRIRIIEDSGSKKRRLEIEALLTLPYDGNTNPDLVVIIITRFLQFGRISGVTWMGTYSIYRGTGMDHEGCEILNYWPPYVEKLGCADLLELGSIGPTYSSYEREKRGSNEELMVHIQQSTSRRGLHSFYPLYLHASIGAPYLWGGYRT